MDTTNLLKSKRFDGELLYWRTDSHWSSYGAYQVYLEACNILKISPVVSIQKFSAQELFVLWDLGAKLDPPVKERSKVVSIQRNAKLEFQNELVKFKEEHDNKNEATLHVGSRVIFKNPAAEHKQKLILFGDSFAEYRPYYLTAMFAETFSEVHFVWHSSLDYKYIDLISPDIVISELAERFVTRLPTDTVDIDKFASDKLDSFLSHRSE